MYRGEFIAFIRRNFSVDDDEIVDIYQESFIALYENIRNGKLEHLSASLKTYLFSIGRNKILNRQRVSSRVEALKNDYFANEDDGWGLRQEITYNMVREMTEPCNTVLTLFYWERKSMEDIAGAMNYASAQVAKNRKSICMNKLRTILTERFRTEGLL